MGDFSGTTKVAADVDTLFDYLADLNNLPDYFSRLTSAVPAHSDGDRITTMARIPDRGEVQGDAWFRVDDTQKRIEWGAEGTSDYHGHLEVTSSGDAAQIDVYVHTPPASTTETRWRRTPSARPRPTSDGSWKLTAQSTDIRRPEVAARRLTRHPGDRLSSPRGRFAPEGPIAMPQ